jgi:hypothetical protein
MAGMPRRFLLGVLCVYGLLLGGTVPATADDATESQIDTSSWAGGTVPDVNLSLKYPPDWVERPGGALPPPPAQRLFSKVNSQNGDNLTVIRYRDPNTTYWFSGIKDFKKASRESATLSNGKLLSVAKSTVGVLPAYTELETYIDPQTKVRVVYGQIEIRLQDRSVVAVVVKLAATPSAEANAKAMLASVSPA